VPPTSFPAVADSPPAPNPPFLPAFWLRNRFGPGLFFVLVKLPLHLSSQPAAPQRPLPTTKRKMTTFCHHRHHTHTPPILSPRNGPPHWRLASTSWGDSLQTKTTTAEATLSLLILIPFPTQYDRATSAKCSEECIVPDVILDQRRPKWITRIVDSSLFAHCFFSPRTPLPRYIAEQGIHIPAGSSREDASVGASCARRLEKKGQ